MDVVEIVAEDVVEEEEEETATPELEQLNRKDCVPHLACVRFASGSVPPVHIVADDGHSHEDITLLMLRVASLMAISLQRHHES